MGTHEFDRLVPLAQEKGIRVRRQGDGLGDQGIQIDVLDPGNDFHILNIGGLPAS